MKNFVINLIASLLTIAIFLGFGFLIFLPKIFNFSTASACGKVFMILGSITFLALHILVIVFSEKDYKKTKDKSKRFRKLFIFTTITYLYFLLAYINFEIWNSLPYVFFAVFIIGLILTSYDIIVRFDSFFNKEKIPMGIGIITVFLIMMAVIVAQLEDKTIAIYLIKIALGILYVLIIAIYLNLTLLSKKEFNTDKNAVLKLLFGITFALVVLVSVPFYVAWCGLSGDNFDTFVTIYASIIGGGLTLLSVAWTIRHGDKLRLKELEQIEKERKEEELKKAKPLFAVNLKLNDDLPRDCNNCLFNINGNKKSKYPVYAAFQNSDNSNFFVKKLYINEKWYSPIVNFTVLKGQVFFITFYVTSKQLKKLESFLVFEDYLGNEYSYKLNYVYIDSSFYFTLRSIKEISKDELPQENKLWTHRKNGLNRILKVSL